jgi:hypothetical protein
MSLFSLSALLENDTAREWLLCRTEDSIQPSTIESAYALKAEVQVDQHLSSLELLVKPVGVVNRVLIGYVRRWSLFTVLFGSPLSGVRRSLLLCSSKVLGPNGASSLSKIYI